MSTSEHTPSETQSTAQLVVGDILAPAAPRQRDLSRRSTSAVWLDARLPAVFAFAGSLPAFVLPLGWLIVCLLVALVLGSVRRAGAPGAANGTADAVVAPLRALGAALRPATLVGALLTAVGAVAAGVVLAGVSGLLTWLAVQGGTGALPAARIAALAYGPRLACVLLCFLLLRRQLSARELSDRLRRHAERAGEATVTGVAAAAVLAGVVIVLVVAVSWFPASSGPALVHVLPGALRQQVTRGEAHLAESEARAVVTCLAERGRAWGWRVGAATSMPDGTVRIAVRTHARPSRRQISSLALALDNQLMPYVARVRVLAGRRGLTFERRDRGRGGPVGDPTVLAATGPLAGPGLPSSRGVRTAALACSAPAL